MFLYWLDKAAWVQFSPHIPPRIAISPPIRPAVDITAVGKIRDGVPFSTDALLGSMFISNCFLQLVAANKTIKAAAIYSFILIFILSKFYLLKNCFQRYAKRF